MAAPVQQHYYPTPQNLMKKRCAFVSEAKPVVCTICDGIHYRFEPAEVDALSALLIGIL
jgi:hypothetical protein